MTGSKPTPASTWPFATVMVVSFGGTSELATSLAAIPPIATVLTAIDNAVRTVLAVLSMDETRAQGRSRITTRLVAGTAVTTLDPPISFAYAIDRAHNRLVLSNSPAAVARLPYARGRFQGGFKIARIRDSAFADAVTYACVDFDALAVIVDTHRGRLVQTLAARQKRSAAEVDRDLAHALALARLFRAGFIASRFDDDATSVQRRIGLIRHEHNAN